MNKRKDSQDCSEQFPVFNLPQSPSSHYPTACSYHMFNSPSPPIWTNLKIHWKKTKYGNPKWLENKVLGHFCWRKQKVQPWTLEGFSKKSKISIIYSNDNQIITNYNRLGQLGFLVVIFIFMWLYKVLYIVLSIELQVKSIDKIMLNLYKYICLHINGYFEVSCFMYRVKGSVTMIYHRFR